MVRSILVTLLVVCASFSSVSWGRPKADLTRNPGRYIGKVGGCTGFLIAENAIGTAGHCLEGSATGTFYLRYDDGNFKDSASLDRMLGYGASSGFAEKGGGHLTDGKDWAIARIDKDLGKTYGWLSGASSVPKRLTTLTVAGYGGDVKGGEEPSQDTCSVTNAYTDYFNHNCDLAKGHSGSPMVDSTGTVVGIFTGWASLVGTGTPFTKAFDTYYAAVMKKTSSSSTTLVSNTTPSYTAPSRTTTTTPTKSLSDYSDEDLIKAYVALKLLQQQQQQQQRPQVIYYQQPVYLVPVYQVQPVYVYPTYGPTVYYRR